MAKMKQNDKFVIETPKGKIFTHKIVSGKNKGKITAKFEWNKNFGKQKTEQFSRAQKFLDSEVLRTTDPYVPFQSGALKMSGKLGTTIGSGEVNYIAPYAAAQYYRTANGPAVAQRGPQWFERAKIDHKEEWLSGVKKIGGGK